MRLNSLLNEIYLYILKRCSRLEQNQITEIRSKAFADLRKLRRM